jgi:hypothetical protein
MNELGMMLTYGIAAYPAEGRLLARFCSGIPINKENLRSSRAYSESSRSHAPRDPGSDHDSVILRLHGTPSLHILTILGRTWL